VYKAKHLSKRMVSQELPNSCGAACARQLLLDAGLQVPEATIREGDEARGRLASRPETLPIRDGARVHEWSPDQSMLVGIVTQWRPDAKALVATKVEAIVDLLNESPSA
jgi:hypothetical protein